MPESPKAFAISCSEDVVVHVDDSSEDEKFDISVRKGGETLEEHSGLTAETVGDAKSEHFTVEYIEPPTAEEAQDGED